MVPDSCYKLLFEALREQSIEAVMEAAYAIFGLPVVFTDAEFVVVGKFPNESLDDEQWDANIVGSQIGLRFIKTFTDDEHFRRHAEAGRPILINWGHYEHAPRLTAVVKDSGEVVGYFSVLMTGHDIEPWHIDAADLVSEAIVAVLRSSGASTASPKDILTATLRSLLSGSIATPADMALIPARFSSLIRGPYTLLCGRTEDPSNVQLEAYLGGRFADSVSCAVQATYEDSLYVIVGAAADPSMPVPLDLALRALSDQGIVCGVSGSFSDILDFPAYKWQADQALRVGLVAEPGKRCYRYQDVIVDVAIDSMLAAMPAHSLSHPALVQLSRHDAENGTEYLHTLEACVQMNFDKKAASEILHVHRNTLLYRLGKIEEMVGFELSEISKDAYFKLYFAALSYQRKCGLAHVGGIEGRALS